MTTLTLNNSNQDSALKQIAINLAEGTCVVDGQVIRPARLAEFDFCHPLLTVKVPKQWNLESVIFHYKYDDLEGLLTAGRFIYATLLRVKNADACEFRIIPSKHFVRLSNHARIPFSINAKSDASNWLSSQQFNRLVSDLNGFDFQYQDTIILDHTIQLCNLPETINGDVLFETQPDIVQFCRQGDDIQKIELRYINRKMGLGVFARQDIDAGELLFQYCGVKVGLINETGAYTFSQEKDVLHLRTDAMHFGSIARFINHAPNQHSLPDDSGVLVANIAVKKYALYGNEVIIYQTITPILKGQQLLVDYGDAYFSNTNNMLLVNKNNGIIDCSNHLIRESDGQKRHALRAMAACGIRQAQWALIKRPLILLTLMLLFSGLFLNH